MNSLLHISTALINNPVILIMARVFALFSILKIFNRMNIHLSTKILLVYLISLLLFPYVSTDSGTNNIYVVDFLSCFFDQIFIGSVLGLSLKLLIVCIFFVEERIRTQLGWSFSFFSNTDNKTHPTVVSYLLSIFFLSFFFLCNRYIYFIMMIIKSFFVSPINKIMSYNHVFSSLFNFSSLIFFKGQEGVLPFLLFFLTLYFVLIILNRLYSNISLSSPYSIIVFGICMTILKNIFYRLFFLSEALVHDVFNFFKDHIFK